MDLSICRTRKELGAAAAAAGADKIREALATRDEVSIVMASAASQFEVIESLLGEAGIEWDRVVLFHLDEYIGLEEDHPASFSKFLRDRFVAKLPREVKRFHAINGCAEPMLECARLGGMITDRDPVVAFIGIGENGHIAFNDPPADFDAIMFHQRSFMLGDIPDPSKRRTDQRYIHWMFESPAHLHYDSTPISKGSHQ